MSPDVTSKIKTGKAPGPSWIVTEMTRTGAGKVITAINNCKNCILYDRNIHNVWNLSYILTCLRGIGYDAYWGIAGWKMLE